MNGDFFKAGGSPGLYRLCHNAIFRHCEEPQATRQSQKRDCFTPEPALKRSRRGVRNDARFTIIPQSECHPDPGHIRFAVCKLREGEGSHFFSYRRDSLVAEFTLKRSRRAPLK